MPWKWYDSIVVKIADETPTTKRFWLEVREVEALDFRAGQFVTMDLPIHEKRLKRWRSYSIANAPDGTNILEFCIVKLEGGLGTSYLFDEVKEGTTIRFKGPTGAFCLKEPIDYDLVMVCTGTGIAPFRSMLWDIYQQQKRHQNIHLIFGTRYTKNILYQNEWDDFLSKLPNLKISVALSREENLPSPPNWEAQKGYVHAIYKKYYATPNANRHFYLCGWSNMIDEAVATLEELAYDKSQIHYELYG